MIYGITAASMHETEVNRRRSQDLYTTLGRLLIETLVRTFSGKVSLEYDVKQGTIVGIGTSRKERL